MEPLSLNILSLTSISVTINLPYINLYLYQRYLNHTIYKVLVKSRRTIRRIRLIQPQEEVNHVSFPEIK
ncbi:hypothetical protein NP233_g1878 [Leucocoprinus birnbaumii]|uniref:Uncharacterized protein n=1 Tax=Leucocoprinus birnbaumii TaxID=56174 RepID=A0AAD5W569_9AGAR|nr:hypothetical protein NP233_g1878 [Leucocoprinus birnbaumii]